MTSELICCRFNKWDTTTRPTCKLIEDGEKVKKDRKKVDENADFEF